MTTLMELAATLLILMVNWQDSRLSMGVWLSSRSVGYVVTSNKLLITCLLLLLELTNPVTANVVTKCIT